MEDISDPNTDSDTSAFTNIVGIVVYWNAISCITSAYVFFFDVMSSEEPNGEPFKAKEAPLWFFLGLLFFMTGWPLVSLPFFCGRVQSSIAAVLWFCFYLFAILVHGSQHLKDSMQSTEDAIINRNNSRYPARKKIVYWVGYTITAPALVMCCNMLLQRRDTLFNFTTVFMTVCIGLCSLGSEMVYTAYEHFYISHYRKKHDIAIKPGLQVQYDIDNAVLNFREQKNAMVKLSLLVILILVLGIGCTSFPAFVSTPFSNAYPAILVVLPIMLVIPPLVTGRIISLVPSAEDVGNSGGKGSAFASGTSGQTWVLELITIELLARAFFTVPVMYDLYSVGISDSSIISLPHQY